MLRPYHAQAFRLAMPRLRIDSSQDVSLVLIPLTKFDSVLMQGPRARAVPEAERAPSPQMLERSRRGESVCAKNCSFESRNLVAQLLDGVRLGPCGFGAQAL